MSVAWSIRERAREVLLRGCMELVVADPGDGSAAGLLSLVGEQALFWRRELRGWLGDGRAIRMPIDIRVRSASSDEDRYVRSVAGGVLARLRNTSDALYEFMVAQQMPAEVRSMCDRVGMWARLSPARALNYVIPFGAAPPRGAEYPLTSCVMSGAVLLYAEPDRSGDRRFGASHHSLGHEIGHLLGLADLYRHSRTGDPTCPPQHQNNIMCSHEHYSEPRVHALQVREAAEHALGAVLEQQRHPLGPFQRLRQRTLTTWTPYHVASYRDERSRARGSYDSLGW